MIAQAPTPEPSTDTRAERSPAAPAEVSEQTAQASVQSVRAAVESAEFAAAAAAARALLAGNMTARERNDTLELLAIAEIAARQEGPAQATLSELFARDPEHPERLRDPGPQVETFFARVRAQNHPSIASALQVSAMRDARARVLVDVQLGAGSDAVESVHVFARRPGQPTLSLLPELSPPERAVEPAHVVADVLSRSRLTLALPPLSPVSLRSDFVELYVEARAPSGFVLGRAGSAAAPLRVPIEPDLAPKDETRPTPLRRTWWLWTSVAIVAAGIGVTAAVLAH